MCNIKNNLAWSFDTLKTTSETPEKWSMEVDNKDAGDAVDSAPGIDASETTTGGTAAVATNASEFKGENKAPISKRSRRKKNSYRKKNAERNAEQKMDAETTAPSKRRPKYFCQF